MTEEIARQNKVPAEDMLNLAKQFVAIPSTADNPTALEEIIALAGDQLSEFTVETFFAQGKPSLLIHNRERGTKKFKIVFNAHLDVVPGDSEQYRPSVKDGRLYGRGAYDMKAAAAVMIFLFKDIANSVSYPLALQITADEETGCLGAKKQVEEGVLADFALSGECGNNFKITNKAKGVCQIKITAEGTAAHGAYPWKGDNAVVKLHKTLATILEKYPHAEEESYNTTVNITRIFTNNQTTNKTPDHCEAYLDIRYIPEDKNIFEEIKNLLPKDVTAERTMAVAPLDTRENNKYLTLLQEEGKKVLHHDLELRFAHATSDIVRFAEVDCEGVEFGPIGANQHAEDEWVDIKSLEDYYTILNQFLLAIDKK